jgi:large subunit ribosomal protein L10
MQREEKTKVVDEVRDRFERMSSAVFVDYSGMTVAAANKLRDNCRARGVDYRVVKNTLLLRALGDKPYAATLAKSLNGMTAVAWSYEEPSAAARLLKDYIKENEKPALKAGLLDGQVLDAKAVENQLATLPSKDEARAMLLATFMAPAQQLVMLLNTPAGNFVRVLNAKQNSAT